MSARRKLKRLRWTEPPEHCEECGDHLKRSGDDYRYCVNPSCACYLLRTARGLVTP